MVTTAAFAPPPLLVNCSRRFREARMLDTVHGGADGGPVNWLLTTSSRSPAIAAVVGPWKLGSRGLRQQPTTVVPRVEAELGDERADRANDVEDVVVGEDHPVAAEQAVAAEIDLPDLLVGQPDAEQDAVAVVHDQQVLAVGRGDDAVRIEESRLIVRVRRVLPFEEDGKVLHGGTRVRGARPRGSGRAPGARSR